MLSRGFSTFFAVASLVQVHAWMGQHDIKAARKAFLPTSSEPKNSDDIGLQVASLGFGCFLAAATAFATPAFADAGRFSYDPNLGGPETWSSLKVEGNQCSGSKQSPIAIKPTACNVGANYEFKVSGWRSSLAFCIHFFLRNVGAACNLFHIGSRLCPWEKWAEGFVSPRV